MALSDWADWWDEQNKDSERILGQFVEDNPQWWAIGIATMTSTAMTLGAGMVDVLRLGQGVAQGGVTGVGKDALRLLVVAGPLTRAFGMLSRVAHTSMIKLAVTTHGVTGPCTFTAVNNALSIVSGRGRSLFLTARQAAAALGKRTSDLQQVGANYKLAAWIDDLIPFLRTQGVRIRDLGRPASIEDVVSAARRNDGVIIFAIRWVDATGRVGKHSMIAARDALGRVRFADYGGRWINHLGELARRGPKWAAQGGRYEIHTGTRGGSAVAVEGLELTGLMESALSVFRGGMLLVEGMTAVETVDDGVDLAFPVEVAAAVDGSVEPAPVIQRAYAAYKERARGRRVVRMPSLEIRGSRPKAPRAEYLTGVQYRLNASGFAAGPIDGIMDPKTRRAVRAFQAESGIDVDGIPGPITQARLVEFCGF